MRNLMLSLILAGAGAAGLAAAPQAEARDSGRIFVGIGDVTFSYGRPYWRHNYEPLYVVYEHGYPRYYRVVTPGYYAPPRYVYAPPHWSYDDRRYRSGWDYRDHDRRWDRRDRGRDHRRDRDRDRRRGW